MFGSTAGASIISAILAPVIGGIGAFFVNTLLVFTNTSAPSPADNPAKQQIITYGD